MGKKVKKKARCGQKDKRGPSVSPTSVPQQDSSNAEAPVNEVVVIRDRGVCTHLDTGISLEKLSSKLRSTESIKCQDCRGNAIDRRAKKGQGKHGKKGGSSSKSECKAIWICLECGHYSCGGVGLPTTPQSHVIRHSKQNHHPLVVHYEKHQLVWCFPCDKLIPAENSEDNKHKEVLNEVVKLLKAKPGEGSTIDVEDVWFGSGSVTSAIKSDYSISTGADEKAGYTIRGLSNLGNTCYFNSIMQNLLAINSLREYFSKLDESVGSLSASMRNFFLETSNEAGSKGVVNPRSLFGSLCIKAPQFKGYQQHDSHELLRCLLDGLSTEELSIKKDTKSSQASITHPTFVDVIFGGQLSSTVSCLECGHTSTIYEPFLDLSLPVPTKKPPLKKTQATTRGKKPKLPPKRSGRNLPKVIKETNTLPRESASVQSTSGNSSGEQTGPSLSDSVLSDSADLNNVALDMGLTAGDLSAIQNPPAVEPVGGQSVSDDSFTWLDYLDPDPDPVSHEIDVATETDDVSAVQDFANEDDQQHGVLLSVATDSRTESNAVNDVSTDNAKDFSSPESEVIAHEQNIEDVQHIKPEINGRLSPDGSLTEEVVLNDANMGQCPESSSEVCTKDSNTSGTDSKTSSQILDSQVMSFPSEEAASSSAVVDEEQDSLGFGDLFNEPEVFSGPLDQAASQASDIAKKGVIANASESDPDEVDNSDAPVSVESCLALFTKPEFLSKDEHAWQCDNCSKVLREQKNKLRKLQMPLSDSVPNGIEDRNPSGLLDVEKTSNTKRIINGNLEVDPSDGKSVPQADICENGKCQFECETNASDSLSENTELRATNACYGPSECSTSSSQTLNRHSGESDSDKDGFEESDLLSKKREPEKKEQVEVNLENLKVKRDANKSILISKVPSVLTIHLKRFSQDARGRLSKLNGHVNFKETIDVKPYIDPRCSDKDMLTYCLVGVVEHLGTMRGGHYVAYVRGKKDGVWYHASDAYVRQASLEEVLRSEAYILFYERT
ncbi:hypothetical protein ACS0TY_022774 [Phlomoides rotata]